MAQAIPYVIQGVMALAAGASKQAQAGKEAEAERIATGQKIEQRTDQIVNLLGRQRSAYLGAGGVKLSGSAQQVIQETREKGAEDVRRLGKIGARRAESLLLGGQTAMFQSIGSAVGSFSAAGRAGGSTPTDTTGLLGPTHL